MRNGFWWGWKRFSLGSKDPVSCRDCFVYLSGINREASLVAQLVNNLPTIWETWVWFLGCEDLLEKGTATHSSTLAWRIPWTEEPGGPQSMGSQRVRHNWVTFNFLFSLASDWPLLVLNEMRTQWVIGREIHFLRSKPTFLSIIEGQKRKELG